MVVESDAGTISRINIYPIKSFPGVAVSSSRVLSSGALEWDRRLALVDPGGDFINFKRVPELHMIRADYQLDVPTVRIWTGDSITARTFNLVEERESLGDYLTCLLNRPVGIVDNPLAGFQTTLTRMDRRSFQSRLLSVSPTCFQTSRSNRLAGDFAPISKSKVCHRSGKIACSTASWSRFRFRLAE